MWICYINSTNLACNWKVCENDILCHIHKAFIKIYIEAKWVEFIYVTQSNYIIFD